MKHIGELAGELSEYMKALKRLGLRDYQVMHIKWWSFADLLGRTLWVATLLCLGTVPQVLFNLPVGILARALAVKEQRKALRSSSVKIAARDVLMSYKILYCLCFLPCLILAYLLGLVFFSGLTYTSIILLCLAMPLFSLFGVKASEQGVRVWTDVLPLISRFRPARRREQDALPARRARLQQKVRRAVREIGPLVNNIYSVNKVDWSKELPQEGAHWKIPDGINLLRRPSSGIRVSDGGG